VAISDIPKIVCAVCGQGAHDECIEELDLTKIDFGYSLVCTRCIPSPKEKKKKSTTKDKAQTEKSKTLKHDETDTDSAKKEENKDNDSINAEYLDASDNIDPHQDKDEYKTDRGNGNIKNNILQNHSHQNNTKNNANSQEQTGVASDRSIQTICKYHKKEGCKKGRECKYTHPPICKNFLRDGNSENGCYRKSCKYTHPHICKLSWHQRTCLNLTCPYYHLKGTKRYSDDVNTNTVNVDTYQTVPNRYVTRNGAQERNNFESDNSLHERRPHVYITNPEENIHLGRSYAKALSENKRCNTGSIQDFDKEHFLLNLMRQIQETQNTMMTLLNKERNCQQFPTYQMVPKPM